eukprot:CAMPEP_0170572822 /NCGR_PEP_ID=MMETSP0224-20130122/2430_1 /TAXON_ID=285029 /ORGANISM="Togula jolla, Strain CCCM 725" /LENGTH=483 /DNA_ID=CAMNT_0010895355 /DNA_START=8 /DNA_END=1456 /DNA_ORIENTATION=+
MSSALQLSDDEDDDEPVGGGGDDPDYLWGLRSHVKRNVNEDNERNSDESEPEDEEAKHLSRSYIACFQVMWVRNLISIPKQSVISTAICFPQLARCSGYARTFSAMSIKHVILAFLSLWMQAFLLEAMRQALLTIDQADGVPHLCTYGFDYGDDANPPKGPLGLAYERSRGNIEPSYQKLMLRNTIAQLMRSLAAANVTTLVNDEMGPVDYGLESPNCRFLSVTMFLISLSGEMVALWRWAVYLWKSPRRKLMASGQSSSSSSEDEFGFGDNDNCQWIKFRDWPDTSQNPAKRKELWNALEKTELDHIRFVATGMPLGWKIYSGLLVFMKAVILIELSWIGLMFLMHTGVIIKLILNSVALLFIVDVDLIFFESFSGRMAKDLLKRIQPFQVPTTPKSLVQGQKAMEREHNWNLWRLVFSSISFSRQLILILIGTVLANYAYLFTYCKPVQAPLTGQFRWTADFFDASSYTFGGLDFWFGRWI